MPSVRLAFEFLLLTAALSSEVWVATLDEIDMGRGVSTTVAVRMKANHEYPAPLCRLALEALDAARTLSDCNRLVFLMRTGRPIAASMLPRVHRYPEVPAVPRRIRRRR